MGVILDWKRIVLWAIILVAVMGVFIALTNLPVVTGCGYYARCGTSAVVD